MPYSHSIHRFASAAPPPGAKLMLSLSSLVSPSPKPHNMNQTADKSLAYFNIAAFNRLLTTLPTTASLLNSLTSTTLSHHADDIARDCTNLVTAWDEASASLTSAYFSDALSEHFAPISTLLSACAVEATKAKDARTAISQHPHDPERVVLAEDAFDDAFMRLTELAMLLDFCLCKLRLATQDALRS